VSAEEYAAPFRAVPCGRYDEGRPPISAAKDAGEAAPIQLDRLQHRSTFTYPYTVRVGHIGIPGGALCQSSAVSAQRTSAILHNQIGGNTAQSSEPPTASYAVPGEHGPGQRGRPHPLSVAAVAARI